MGKSFPQAGSKGQIHGFCVTDTGSVSQMQILCGALGAGGIISKRHTLLRLIAAQQVKRRARIHDPEPMVPVRSEVVSGANEDVQCLMTMKIMRFIAVRFLLFT